MIISASVVKKPRVKRTCVGCAFGDPHEIKGPAVRLYGSAGFSDPPWVLWSCRESALADLSAILKMSDRDFEFLLAEGSK